MVVRSEDRLAADPLVQMLTHRPGDRDTVIRAGASTDLVEQDEAAARCGVQDGARLRHLHHERRLSAHQVVARADSREDAVTDANGRGYGGGGAAHLGPWGEAGPPS